MTKYTPHHAVTSHPRGKILFTVYGFGDRHKDVASVCGAIKGWKQMSHITPQADFQTLMKAIIWDLKTHYGVTDEDLGPPSPYFPV